MHLRVRIFLLPLLISYSLLGQDANITAMEYYLDTDPGVGNGVAVTITSGSTQDVDFTVSAGSLSVGFHEIVVRIMDENGDWSIQESQVFYVSGSAVTTTADISAMEYFIDTDPGYGNGTAISVTAATSVDIQVAIPTGSLSAGMHEVFVRAMDSDGIWGLMSSRAFYVDSFTSAGGVNELSSIEYFIDTDPGLGSGTQIAISPTQASIDTDVMLNTSSLPDGNYTLGMRVGDTNGNYSTTEQVAFSICDAASADFSATTVCLGSVTDFTDLSTGVMAGDSYSWDFDGDAVEDDNTAGNTNFTYVSTGTYTATLSIDRSGCVNTIQVTVTVEDVPSAAAGADQNISIDNTVLAATAAATGETGTWTILSGTGTFSDANDPTATITGLTTSETQLRWTVVNDLAGCSTSDDVSIFMSSSLSTETDILTFTLPEEYSAADIDNSGHTISILVDLGTDLTALTPTMTLSTGASISPTGAQDFTNTVVYTVTAEDGATVQDWSVDAAERPLGLGVVQDLHVYPNPTKEMLVISGIDLPYAVSLSDVSGKKVDLGRNIKEVSLKEYSAGMYVIHIEIEGSDPVSIRVFKE